MNQKMLKRRVAFVTGGSGFVGSRLVQVLVANNWEVRALARSSSAVSEVKKLGAIPVSGDLNDLQALQQGMADSEVVFHVAALFKLWGDKKEFDHINVEGMKMVVQAAAATASIRKVVSVGAAAVVMGDPDSMLNVDENAPVQVCSFAPYSASKAKAERILLSANGLRPEFDTISIRPPMIWGAGMPTLDHMVETVNAGHWQWIDGGDQSMSTCHVDNLISALLLAADRGRGGQAYFVADAEIGTLKSVLSELLLTKNVKAGEKSVSFGMAWTMAGVLGSAWCLFRLRGEPPITRQMLRLIGKSFTVSYEKARNELGYIPLVSWAQGVRSMSYGLDNSHKHSI